MIEVPEPDGYDEQTLREVFADPAVVSRSIEQLRAALRTPEDPDDPTEELYHRGMLAEFLRIGEHHDDAADEAEFALRRAYEVGLPSQQQAARIRLAQVRQWRREFDRSDELFAEVLQHAEEFGPVLAGFAHHHAGLNDYDQGRWTAAAEEFARALAARRGIEAPEDQITRSEQALAAAGRHRGETP